MKLLRSVYLYFLLFAVSCVAVWLYTQNRSLDIEQFNKRSALMLELRIAEAALDRYALQTSSLLLMQYDAIVDTQRHIEELVAELGSIEMGEIIQGSEQRELEMLEHYKDALGEKLAAIERLKSAAALTRNGINYLPLAVEELITERPEEGMALRTLLVRMLRYRLLPTGSEALQLEQSLQTLQTTGEERGYSLKFRSALLHMQTNLKLLGEVVRWQERYLAAPTDERFNQFYADHTQHYTKYTKRSEQLATLLLGATILFFVSLGLALRHLIETRKQVRRSWLQLRDAVGTLSEAFALFDASGRLLLHNDRFAEFYPWIAAVLKEGSSLREITDALEASEEIVESLAPDGQPESLCSEWGGRLRKHYTEHTRDGQWHLASDSLTSAGETVCVRVDITQSKSSEQELAKLHRAVEQSPASIIITNREGTIEYVNPKFESVTGFSAAEAVGQNPRLLKSGDKSPEDYADLWETIMSGRVWRGQFHNRRKDGEIFWEAASISPVRDDDGEITHFIAVKEDITARKRAEDQLILNATVFDTTNEGILVTDANNRIKTANPAFTRITGYSQEEVVGRTPNLLSSGQQGREFYEQLWSQLLEHGSWAGEIWNRRKDGSVYPEWLSLSIIRDQEGNVKEHVAVFSDITQRKQSEEQIRHQANYDALTDLPNRTLMTDRLAHALSAAERDGTMVALLFIDLDRFKGVNDTLGHVTGDKLLQLVATRLNSTLRGSDTVARFGGDEFAVILEKVRHANDAAEIAEKLIQNLQRPFILKERPVYIGSSIGITLYPSDSTSVTNMLRNADMAMYKAKENGNSYHFFTEKLNAEAHRVLGLEQDLRRALQHEELLIHYQPVVSLEDGRLTAVEALVRWQHPERGLVMPTEFIQLAEDAGTILPIGRWVLETACAQLNTWRTQYPDCHFTLNVNLSSRQLSLGFSTQDVIGILDGMNFEHSDLTLEITEGLLLQKLPEVQRWLQEVREAGIKLAIDDFGTGYSSLSYLQHLPLDTLKIDRSFVTGLPDDSDSTSLVKAIISMAHSLRLKVVAEGVETEAQREFLHSLGCEYGQGYLFSRPLSAAHLTDRYVDPEATGAFFTRKR